MLDSEMSSSKPSIYESITETVVRAMETTGRIPWIQPWSARGGSAPYNLKSGKPYRGVNVIILMVTSMERGYGAGAWLTYKQAKELGGHVRRGEKGTQIVFWKPTKRTEKDSKTGEETTKRSVIARTYTVFHVEQCEGIEAETVKEPEWTEGENAEAEALLTAWAEECPMEHGGHGAFYSPSFDRIQLPERGQFATLAGYYTTAFHEMGHSTGHESRLNRDLSPLAKIHSYAKEELIAELTACFLAATTGVRRTADEHTNSVAYLKSWASKLRDDPKLIMSAAQSAQKAADLIQSKIAAEKQEQAA